MNNIKLKYLTHNEIDYSRWDTCIAGAYNGIIYAYSWYLDITCPGWEALIEGDYEIVLPLTAGKKYGINYLYQPYFSQQLGVFSLKKLDSEIVEYFIKSIPEHYKFIEINLNTFNKIQNSKLISKRNVTYELDLIRSHENIGKDYSSNTKRNIKKALENKIYLAKGTQPEQLIELFRQTQVRDLKKIKNSDYNNLQKILQLTISNKIGQIYFAYNKDHEICAGASFVTTHRKSIMLLSASNKEGKDKSAMFAIIDGFIKINAERNITLDFEGSNVEGIARFYGSFGAKPCDYVTVKINKLPSLIKIFKK